MKLGLNIKSHTDSIYKLEKRLDPVNPPYMEYYKSTSNTSPTMGSWSKTIPFWENGYFLWTRWVYAYTNGTLEMSDPVLDKTWSIMTDYEASKSWTKRFDELTNYGKVKGIVCDPISGALYFNADYINAGKIKAQYIDIDGLATFNGGNNAIAHTYKLVKRWAQDPTSDTTTINGGLIQTNTITADKIAIGDFTNIFQMNKNNCSNYDFDFDHSANGVYHLSSIRRDHMMGTPVTCKPGEVIHVKAEIYSSCHSNESTPYWYPIGIGICCIDTTGKAIAWNAIYGFPTNASRYKSIEGTVTVPNNVHTVQAWMQIRDDDHPLSAGYAESDVWVSNCEIRKMNAGELIVDGAITTNKLASKSVNASILADDSVDGRILADNAISNSNFKDENYGTSSSWINLKSGKMNLGGKLTWDGSNLGINGNGSFSGNITAKSGEIGGWSISNDSLKAGAKWANYISEISPDQFTIQYDNSGIGIGKLWDGKYYLRSANTIGGASYIYGESYNLRLRAYSLFSGDSVENFSITNRETTKTPQKESLVEIGPYGINIGSYEHNNNSEGDAVQFGGGYKNKSTIYINPNYIDLSVNQNFYFSMSSSKFTLRSVDLENLNSLCFKDGMTLLNLRDYSTFNNYIEFTFSDSFSSGNNVLGVTCWKSDKTLKTNIIDTNVNGSYILKNIEFKQFDWISTGKHENIGVIAQDLEKIDGNLVLKIKQCDGTYSYQINPNEFATITAKALQEQMTRIDNMEININNKILQTKNDLLLENQKLKDKLSFLEEKVKYMNGEKSSYSE